MPQCSNGRKKVQLWKVIPFLFEGIFTTTSLDTRIKYLGWSSVEIEVKTCNQSL